MNLISFLMPALRNTFCLLLCMFYWPIHAKIATSLVPVHHLIPRSFLLQKMKAWGKLRHPKSMILWATRHVELEILHSVKKELIMLRQKRLFVRKKSKNGSKNKNRSSACAIWPWPVPLPPRGFHWTAQKQGWPDSHYGGSFTYYV